MPVVDDEDFINSVLKVVESRPGITTKKIVAAFKNKRESATRKEVNSCLYQLQNREKVKKVTSSSDTAPQWYSSTDHENLIFNSFFIDSLYCSSTFLLFAFGFCVFDIHQI